MNDNITNNAEEGIQFGAGPAAITGNTFWTWAVNASACALAPNMYITNTQQGLTGTNYANYSQTFVGNAITGNSYGACNDTPNIQGPYALTFSGNSLALFVPPTNPTDLTIYPSGVFALGCQNLNVCGNTITTGGSGVIFGSSCSNSVILANNFSGVSQRSIIDWGTGTEINNQAIGNVLSRGYSYHLKAEFQNGPIWFLYNNQYWDVHSNNVPIFTDAADLWAHITP